MAKQISFLGLGNMGGAMAANLVKAGFEVRGFDPSPGASERAAREGVIITDSPAAAAQNAEVVCSSISDTEHVFGAYLYEKGALSTAAEGTVCFDFSTISVEGSRRVADEAKKAGVSFLDTPVSGSVPHARAATLVIMAGGEESALKAHKDVLDAIGGEVYYFGPNGAGLTMKLVTNLILAIHLAGIAEGLTLGKKAGLDPEAMVNFLKKSVVPKILEYKAGSMVAKDYTPIATLNIILKDLRIITAMAENEQVPIPLGSLSRQAYVGAASMGYDEQDLNAVVEYFEKGAGM